MVAGIFFRSRLKNFSINIIFLVTLYTLPLPFGPIAPVLFLRFTFLFLLPEAEEFFFPVSTFEKAVLHFSMPQHAIIIMRLLLTAEKDNFYT